MSDFPNRKPRRLTLALLVVALAALIFVQLFVTFRGLSSPLGMEQAQLARELARGHGFQSRVITPYAWRQLLNAGKDPAPDALRDTMEPPLQPLVLAPIFKVLQNQWPMSEKRNVHLMDRVVACVEVLFFLAACAVTWATARRLFDEKIASWSVAVALLSGFLWDVARSGLPQMMALFFFSIALWALARGLERVEEEESATREAFTIGIMGACLVLTHWLGVCLALGLAGVAAWRLRPRLACSLYASAIPLLAVIGWGIRNHMASGDFFGGSRPMLEAMFSPYRESWLLRDFSNTGIQALSGIFFRKLFYNAVSQLHDIWKHFGGAVPALLFFAALLHPFKRNDVRHFARALAVIWLVAAAGMAAVGLPRQEEDVNQIHSLFIPVMGVFGTAFLMVLWARMGLNTPHGGWWADHGAPALATGVSALPLLMSLYLDLSSGLSSKGQFAHWPPYLPSQIARLTAFTGEHELIMSDVPWAVAWYADRPSAWIPQQKKQFAEMRQKAEEKNVSIAGFLFTPESLHADRPAEAFTGEYQEWAAETFRGLAFGFGVDILARSDFPYREFLPLSRQPVGDHILVEMMFMSDRKRWEQGPTPVADSGTRAAPSTANPR